MLLVLCHVIIYLQNTSLCLVDKYGLTYFILDNLEYTAEAVPVLRWFTILFIFCIFFFKIQMPWEFTSVLSLSHTLWVCYQNCTLGTRNDKNLSYMTEILYPGVCVTLHLWLTEHSGMQCCRRCTTPKASLALAGTACTATWASLALWSLGYNTASV